MPVLARFYGLIIRMYFMNAEHNPPHFHVQYGEYAATIEIDSLEICDGSLPNRAYQLAVEWARQHQDELRRIWETQEFIQLPPLE